MDNELQILENEIQKYKKVLLRRYKLSLQIAQYLNKLRKKLPEYTTILKLLYIGSDSFKVQLPNFPDELYLILVGVLLPDGTFKYYPKFILKEDRKKKISLFRLKLEREIAYKYLELKKEGKIFFDGIVFKTSLLPSPYPYHVPEDYTPKTTRISIPDLLSRLFNLAKKTNTLLLSYTAIPRTVYILSLFNGIVSTKDELKDYVVLHPILNDKEYIYIGKVKEIISPYYNYLRKKQINVTKIKEYLDTSIYFYKKYYVRKVEIYNSELYDPSFVLKYLYSLDTISGLNTFNIIAKKLKHIGKTTHVLSRAVFQNDLKNI